MDMEKKLQGAEPPAKVEKWQKHCVFRVPLRFKVVDASVYKPQTVSLGPFHHNDKDLKPMEEHKMRAVRHLLLRESCKTTLAELVVAIEEVAEELEDAYMDLEDEWRGENRGRFLEMMIMDGCFLLEVMRTTAHASATTTLRKKDSIPTGDYVDGDPIFSPHGIQHIKPFIQRDMLMIENQLPLRLLQRIIAVENGTSPSTGSINSMVLKFMETNDSPERVNLGLHPLDIYRKSMLKTGTETSGDEHHPQGPLNFKSWLCSWLKGPQNNIQRDRGMEIEKETPHLSHPNTPSKKAVPRSALKLSEAGIQFVPSKTGCLDDIKLHNWRLNMPMVLLDDSTAYKFHNMMVFEAMHVYTTNEVTAYVLFLKDLIDSIEDVHLLVKKKVLENDLADNDAAVVRLFNGLTKDVYKNWESGPCKEWENVKNHYRNNRLRVFLYKAWAYLNNKYFKSPWTFLAFVTAILLVVGDIVQTVYAVIGYDPNDSAKAKPKMN